MAAQLTASAFGLAFAIAVTWAGSAHAGTIAVTDTGAAGASTCTLAQAIHAANLANNPLDTTPAGATTVAPLSDSLTTSAGQCLGATAGANEIDLPPGAAIHFSSDTPDNFWYGPNALPPIASAITIEGNGATLAVTPGVSPRLRFFFVGADPLGSGPTPGYNTPGAGSLTLHRLSLSGGRQKGGDSGTIGGGGAGMGGAIFNQGSLTLDAVTLYGNTATGGGNSNENSLAGGGMGASTGMGGAVPNGSSENGGGAGNIVEAGAGGGTGNGLGGNGGDSTGNTPGPGHYGISGDGAGAGGGGGSIGGGGGAGFRGGAGGAGPAYGAGGSFGAGGQNAYGSSTSVQHGGGGGVGGGGGGGANSQGGGGGFGGGGGGGIAASGGAGGFGGGSGGGSGGNTNGGPGFGGGGRVTGSTGGAGAGLGGAIFNHAGKLTLLNCTLTGNTATGGSVAVVGMDGGSGFGGAVFNLNGAVSVSFSTLAANSAVAGSGNHTTGNDGAADGGAIYSLAYNGDGTTGSTAASLVLANSLLANSVGGHDLVIAQPNSVGTAFNLSAGIPGYLSNQATASASIAGKNLVMSALVVSDAASPPALPVFNSSADPMLGALGANGFSNVPFTLQPQGASPAFNGATCNDAGGSPVTADERGSSRPAARCDLGAYNGDHLFINGFD
jgi:hypothetical protein